MIGAMPNGRSQLRYDHRLRHLVQRTGDVTVATALGVPRSTARGWLGAAPTFVVGLEVADLTEPELRQEILRLRRRVRKLTALLGLALALLRSSGFRLTGARLPDGRGKLRILRVLRDNPVEGPDILQRSAHQASVRDAVAIVGEHPYAGPGPGHQAELCEL